MTLPIKRHTWGNLDVFGLLNGVSTWDEQYKNLLYVRKPFDSNLDTRDIIYRSNDNRADITKQGLVNALCNEFNIDPYNTLTKTNFYLSYEPIPSGYIDVQDISGFYKTSSGTWESIGPQIFNENYENAKQSKVGFIVWQKDNFSNIPGYKNFNYSNIVEVFKELDDLTELKFEYYVETVDSEYNKKLQRFTDMNTQTDSIDDRFTYRKPKISFNLETDIISYTLADIPDQLRHMYLDDGKYPTQFYYDLHNYIDSKYKHTWNKITNKSCIWDIHKNYGSGQLSSFFDASAPENIGSDLTYTGYLGGVESLSYSLYSSEFLEISGSKEWYMKIYPGKFYLDGISFYYFENPKVEYLDLTLTGNLFYSTIPSGLERGMYVISAKSGYYDTYYSNYPLDTSLSGVYEDYSYHTGVDGNKFWGNIYRRRPNLSSNQGLQINLELGQYKIDFDSNKIYYNLPVINGYDKVILIYDQILIPSGSILPYDLNPLNNINLNYDKFFMYLSLSPNRYYINNLRY